MAYKTDRTGPDHQDLRRRVAEVMTTVVGGRSTTEMAACCLADAKVRKGRPDEAVRLLDAYLRRCGPSGLVQAKLRALTRG